MKVPETAKSEDYLEKPKVTIKKEPSGTPSFSLKSSKRPLVINLSDSSDAPEGKVPEEPSVQVKSSAASGEEKQMDKITEPEIFDPMVDLPSNSDLENKAQPSLSQELAMEVQKVTGGEEMDVVED